MCSKNEIVYYMVVISLIHNKYDCSDDQNTLACGTWQIILVAGGVASRWLAVGIVVIVIEAAYRNDEILSISHVDEAEAYH